MHWLIIVWFRYPVLKIIYLVELILKINSRFLYKPKYQQKKFLSAFWENHSDFSPENVSN